MIQVYYIHYLRTGSVLCGSTCAVHVGKGEVMGIIVVCGTAVLAVQIQTKLF